MAIFAVLMCVNLASCSSDDDEPQDNFSIEGKWYLSSEEWYSYNENGTPNLTDQTEYEEYPFHSNERIWIITKKGNQSYTLEEYGDVINLELIKGNTYKCDNDLLTFKSVASEKMMVEYIDHYFDFFDKEGNLINNDADEIVDYLELGYYTFTR